MTVGHQSYGRKLCNWSHLLIYCGTSYLISGLQVIIWQEQVKIRTRSENLLKVTQVNAISIPMEYHSKIEM